MTQTYNVYQDSVKVKEGVTAPPVDITGLSPATEYNFQVSSVLNGVESELSESLTVSTKAIDGQGNLVNNFSISGNFDRWSTNVSGSGADMVLQTVPYLNGQDVKALYSSGEADQLYRSVRQKLDPTKMYEISIWVLSENNLITFYFGLETDGGVTRVNRVTGQHVLNDTNPYFITGNAPLVWTKYTGYFAPNGTEPTTLKDVGNVANSFIQTQTNGSFSMRILNYPTTKPRKMWFANPSIFEVNPDQISTNH